MHTRHTIIFRRRGRCRRRPLRDRRCRRTNPLWLYIRVRSWNRASSDRGQATTEYALVLLGAAVVALLVVAWATSGGGAGKIGRLFDRVLDEVTSRV